MARIPYADITTPATKPLVDRITAERGGVLHLYRMLLQSPPVASGWLNYLTAIRQQSTLPGALRELMILRVASLNGAQYEADQHKPIARREGVTQAQVDELDDWRASKAYDEQQRAALAYCDAMTEDIHVSDSVFAGVSASLSPQLVVELTATIAAYNMVSRFLEALGIKSDDMFD